MYSLHLPGVERRQHGFAALGSDGYPDAVFALGIHPQRDSLTAVGEHLDDTPVYEHPQVQELAILELEWCDLGPPCQDIRR